MARSFIDQPTLDVDFIKPQSMVFDVAANVIDGGRNMLNEGISIEATGGGFVTASYKNCYVQQPQEHSYANWLAARLNGSFRFINVPLKTDWQGPFPIFDRFPAMYVTAVPNANGTLIDTGEGYTETTVFGQVLADAASNAGQISIRLFGAPRLIQWSDWFSIYHSAARGWRAYRNWDVISVSDEGSLGGEGALQKYRDYVLAIQPTLRAAVTAGTRVEFVRPRFVAKLAAGARVLSEVQGFWQSSPTLQFTEAF